MSEQNNILPSIDELDFCYFTAGSNWVHWRECFEARKPACPALDSEKRFSTFISEYGLLRGVTRAERLRLRRVIIEIGLIKDCSSGSDVDKLVEALVQRGFRREVSLVSKLAAFYKPEKFIAFDQFARRGLKQVLRLQELPYPYSEYLSHVEALCLSDYGREISEYLQSRHIPANNKQAFYLRVVDVFLMLRGDRWAR
ncbi:hypothetical protein [Tabrizicola sp.]|uniref:hypothetical protein n=1 Tax=Tabrizicola sp. TaxID=2005166 RepID=UPI0027368250|nr:hypothetical protein [Tabrizicola sp.]MDP3196048.1 hypothetical protein [Tabrizicola sp.]MDZ4056919.1 hypothetical protein [Polynucleobacter sp.]